MHAPPPGKQRKRKPSGQAHKPEGDEPRSGCVRRAPGGLRFGVDDAITHGIMPLGVIIFNDNDLPAETEGGSIAWIGENRQRASEIPSRLPNRQGGAENFRQCFLAASDKKGVAYCRRRGLLGRCRAEHADREPAVEAAKYLERIEMALRSALGSKRPHWGVLGRSCARRPRTVAD